VPKVDRFGYVRRAMHGTRMLSRSETFEQYGRDQADADLYLLYPLYPLHPLHSLYPLYPLYTDYTYGRDQVDVDLRSDRWAFLNTLFSVRHSSK
tara:strand:+ start:100 stop:381 length:282 start_codon:yes stop_codon:yes gene_type:complete